ncbi:MAG: hypothetical protein M3Y50_07540 [Acidobacteriota bacterium]|nr:hypothetical protein [Acidobacteriota bacterium]
MYPLPAAILSISSYVIAPLILFRCRPGWKPLLSPLNWFFVIFFLALVATPLVVWTQGPYVSIFPSAPSPFSVNVGLLVYTLAYWSFCAAVHRFRKEDRVIAVASAHRDNDSWYPSNAMIATFLTLGIIGVLLFFRSPERILQYFLDPQAYLLNIDSEGSGRATVADLASLLLRSFFPFSLLLMWSRAFVGTGAVARTREVLLLALIALSSPIYSYERSSVVIPMLSIAAVLSKRKSASGMIILGGLFVGTVGLVIVLTSYRTSPLEQIGAVQAVSMGDQYQTYAMSPQFLGLLLEKTHYGRRLSLGRVLVSSVMTPVPVLGKPFREGSGTSIFGELSGRTDLPSPFAGELFLDFHLGGVIAGFFVVGYLLCLLENAFQTAREPLEIYILQFAAVWLGYTVTSSISVVSLAAIYLAVPIYVILFLRRLRRRTESRP